MNNDGTKWFYWFPIASLVNIPIMAFNLGNIITIDAFEKYADAALAAGVLFEINIELKTKKTIANIRFNL